MPPLVLSVLATAIPHERGLAGKLRSYPRPVIISTDGPPASRSRKDDKGQPYTLTADQWVKELGQVVSLALGGNVRYGARHVELLDNGLLGTSRGDFTKTQYKIDTSLIGKSPAIAEIGKTYVRPASGVTSPSQFVLVRGIDPSDTGRMNSWSFYPEWYLKANPKVAQAQGNDPQKAFLHWQRQGLAQGFAPNPFFKPKVYLARYADLQQAFGSTNYGMAAAHWLANGIYEGRSGA